MKKSIALWAFSSAFSEHLGKFLLKLNKLSEVNMNRSNFSTSSTNAIYRMGLSSPWSTILSEDALIAVWRSTSPDWTGFTWAVSFSIPMIFSFHSPFGFPLNQSSKIMAPSELARPSINVWKSWAVSPHLPFLDPTIRTSFYSISSIAEYESCSHRERSDISDY